MKCIGHAFGPGTLLYPLDRVINHVEGCGSPSGSICVNPEVGSLIRSGSSYGAVQAKRQGASGVVRDGGVRGEADEGVGVAQVHQGKNRRDRLDVVQAKVKLTMNSIADVRQDQVAAARGAKASLG